MLQLKLSALGAKLGYGNTRCIINNQFGSSNDSCTFNQTLPVQILQLSGTKLLRIDIGLQGKHTVYQLFLTHFQAENCYRLILTEGNILCNI